MLMKYFIFLFFPLIGLFSNGSKDNNIALEMKRSLRDDIYNKFYPQAIDRKFGGFLSDFTYDWKPGTPQNKMIVTQSRHIWMLSKAHEFFPENKEYLQYAKHGVDFLRNTMWDKEFGGFHNLVSREGKVLSEDKTAYGNAFAIYGLSAYYKISKDTSALILAKKTFHWLEKNSYDPGYKGYFQILDRDGRNFAKNQKSKDKTRSYKDQNSSIHLLEAFTELYEVWPDDLLRKRLEEMLVLIRDTITTEEGYLALYLQRDWTPVSYRDSARDVHEHNINLDHVSFGHDVETAYLLLEASHVLGLKNDSITEKRAKIMVDHALKNGWDEETGGFYDEGYYFTENGEISILKETKNWWAQAEGFNTLLMMSQKYPDDEQAYYEKFTKLWNYTKNNIIDPVHGGWYMGGIDVQPKLKTAPKASIWKAGYHDARSMMNCIKKLKK